MNPTSSRDNDKAQVGLGHEGDYRHGQNAEIMLVTEAQFGYLYMTLCRT